MTFRYLEHNLERVGGDARVCASGRATRERERERARERACVRACGPRVALFPPRNSTLIQRDTVFTFGEEEKKTPRKTRERERPPRERQTRSFLFETCQNTHVSERIPTRERRRRVASGALGAASAGQAARRPLMISSSPHTYARRSRCLGPHCSTCPWPLCVSLSPFIFQRLI